MSDGRERIERTAQALRDTGLDALICTVPENVLLLTGYWPVVGTAIAVATIDRGVAVLAPEDERDLADGGWAKVRTYQPGSLERLVLPAEAAREPLAALLTDLGLAAGRLGIEDRSVFEEAPYSAVYLFPVSIREVLAGAAPQASPTSGTEVVSRLRSVMTPEEVARVRLACRVAGDAFVAAARELRPGRREPEVAAAFAAPMGERGLAEPGVRRAGAFTWCMSGERSALAGAAYAMTGNRELQRGDLVLVHCNSYIDGYWTDITRTFCLGEPSERQRAMYEAVLAARAAALATIRPGVAAAAVDAAARDVLTEHGFGQYFTHGVGHNVGFSAISAEFPPRLHPASPDRLAEGMTFNVEPSIYIKGFGGLRHCDVVTVRADGPELLTPFQADLADLILTESSAARP